MTKPKPMAERVKGPCVFLLEKDWLMIRGAAGPVSNLLIVRAGVNAIPAEVLSASKEWLVLGYGENREKDRKISAWIAHEGVLDTLRQSNAFHMFPWLAEALADEIGN